MQRSFFQKTVVTGEGTEKEGHPGRRETLTAPPSRAGLVTLSGVPGTGSRKLCPEARRGTRGLLHQSLIRELGRVLVIQGRRRKGCSKTQGLRKEQPSLYGQPVAARRARKTIFLPRRRRAVFQAFRGR